MGKKSLKNPSRAGTTDEIHRLRKLNKRCIRRKDKDWLVMNVRLPHCTLDEKVESRANIMAVCNWQVFVFFCLTNSPMVPSIFKYSTFNSSKVSVYIQGYNHDHVFPKTVIDPLKASASALMGPLDSAVDSVLIFKLLGGSHATFRPAILDKAISRNGSNCPRQPWQMPGILEHIS